MEKVGHMLVPFICRFKVGTNVILKIVPLTLWNLCKGLAGEAGRGQCCSFPKVLLEIDEIYHISLTGFVCLLGMKRLIILI